MRVPLALPGHYPLWDHFDSSRFHGAIPDTVFHTLQRHLPTRTTYLGASPGNARFGLPRISVDLDFNYVGQVGRAQMLAEKSQVEGVIETVARSLGYPTIRAGVEEAHASTRWDLPYTETGGSSDHLEVSISWIHRVPLLATVRRPVYRLHPGYTTETALLGLEELYAGKVAALLERAHPRDLYDVVQVFEDHRAVSS